MAEELNYTRETMKPPIDRLFERVYPDGLSVVHDPAGARQEADARGVDVVYIESGERALHAVRIEESYDECVFDARRGIHTLADVPANYHWLALPLDEFRHWEDFYNNTLEETCRKRGLGIICVRQRGRGLSAKIIIEPEGVEGGFLANYPRLEANHEALLDERVLPPGFEVVERAAL